MSKTHGMTPELIRLSDFNGRHWGRFPNPWVCGCVLRKLFAFPKATAIWLEWSLSPMPEAHEIRIIHPFGLWCAMPRETVSRETLLVPLQKMLYKIFGHVTSGAERTIYLRLLYQ